MSVPKGKKKAFGIIVGHMQNMGKSLEEAKNIADRAISHKEVNDRTVKVKKKKMTMKKIKRVAKKQGRKRS